MNNSFSNTISLIPMPTELLNHEQQLSSELIKTQGSVRMTGQIINYQALNAWERKLADEVDLLPSWAYWWLTLAAELCCSSWSGGVALILPNTEQNATQNVLSAWLRNRTPASYRAQLLTVEDVCFALGSIDWSSSFTFGLAWGVDDYYLHHPVIPLPCRGAVVAVANGLLGALCVASNMDRANLDSWIGNQ